MGANLTSSFYVVAHEVGAEQSALPVWASSHNNPLQLDENHSANCVIRKRVVDVPGAFQLLNVLTATECQRLITLSEALGYQKDAAISLPREIRHNHNTVWVTDELTDSLIWQRVEPILNQNLNISNGKKSLGLNARFRFYRYEVDDFFKFHSDGAWPGSRVIDGKLVGNAYPDRFSLMSFLIFLNDDYSGGATRFRVNADDTSTPAKYYNKVLEVDVHTPAGAVLCFPHGTHPLHCIHSGETIMEGSKYIIRTDVLFEI